jgi:protein deglycase
MQNKFYFFKEKEIDMKKTIFILFLIMVLPAFSYAREDEKVLMIINEGKFEDLELMLTKEVGVMKELLEKAGFKVVTSSASKKPLTASSISLVPDLKLSDVKVDDYAGIIMPCMAVSASPLAPEGETIIKEAAAKGKPIAAQTGSVVLLSRAGLLKGKKYAFAKAWGLQFEDAVYGGDGVIQDGTIITSGICPMIAKQTGSKDGTAKLTKLLIEEIHKKNIQ